MFAPVSGASFLLWGTLFLYPFLVKGGTCATHVNPISRWSYHTSPFGVTIESIVTHSRHGILLISYTSKFCKFCFTQPFLSIFIEKCGNIYLYTKYRKFKQALLACLRIITYLTQPHNYPIDPKTIMTFLDFQPLCKKLIV